MLGSRSKAQGMTLTRAELQVDDAFEAVDSNEVARCQAGQSYVALSRLTGREDLGPESYQKAATLDWITHSIERLVMMRPIL